MPVKFDPHLKFKLPLKPLRFAITPTETIYSQNHFISSETSLQDNVDKFIKNYTLFNNINQTMHIINIYKYKKSVLL